MTTVITSTISSAFKKKLSASTSSITTTTTTTTTKTLKSTTTKTLGSKLCYKGDGYYADTETECRKYYLCAFTKTIYEQISYIECPGKLLFDQNLLLCNEPNLVQCNN